MIIATDLGAQLEGTMPDLMIEAALVLKGIRENFVKDYSEDTVNKLISLIGLMSLADTGEDMRDCARKFKDIIVEDAINYAERTVNGNQDNRDR